MKILKLPSYFYPEKISSSHLSNDLNDAYQKAGFSSEVYAPTPTRGVTDDIRKKYCKIKYEELYNKSVTVRRFSMFREGKNPIIRAFRYVLINITHYFKGIYAKDIDIIMAGSTPPTQGVLCALVKKKLSKKYGRKVPFIYCLHDVFPDALVNANMTKKGSLIWKIGRKIEDYTYNNADEIIVISEDIKANILAKGASSEKIHVIPNWIDVNAVKPIPRSENKLFDELGLDREPFYVTYAGNLGTAQGIDTILSAASILEDRKDIQFVIFGGGVNKDNTEKKVSAMPNVKLFPLQPMDRVSEVYSLGNLSVVACKRGFGTGAVPSKTFSIMATATPLCVSFDEDTELWRLVENNDCGYVSPSDDAEKLASQIIKAQSEQDILSVKGENCRRLVINQFSKEIATQHYIDLINKTVNK